MKRRASREPRALVVDVRDGCVPKTCAEVGAECGPVRDGCGRILNCGNCEGGSASSCGNNVCGRCIESCQTCASQGIECGWAGDGSGGVLFCGRCKAPLTCGGGGVDGQCGEGYDSGLPDGCIPKTCADRDVECGTAHDGCGGTLSCGSCAGGQTCERGRCQ